MATNNYIDCDDFEISSDLRIECAKGDLHNALGIYKEAVEDSGASSPNNKRARDESDIEREVEELLRDASPENLEDAANIERSIEVKEVLDELIDKAVYGGRAERIRDVLFNFFSTQIKEKKWALNKRMPRESRQKEFDDLLTKLKIERRYASSIWRRGVQVWWRERRRLEWSRYQERYFRHLGTSDPSLRKTAICSAMKEANRKAVQRKKRQGR